MEYGKVYGLLTESLFQLTLKSSSLGGRHFQTLSLTWKFYIEIMVYLFLDKYFCNIRPFDFFMKEELCLENA